MTGERGSTVRIYLKTAGGRSPFRGQDASCKASGENLPQSKNRTLPLAVCVYAFTNKVARLTVHAGCLPIAPRLPRGPPKSAVGCQRFSSCNVISVSELQDTHVHHHQTLVPGNGGCHRSDRRLG